MTRISRSALLVTLLLSLPVFAVAVVTEMVSVDSSGNPGNAFSLAGDTSADGRFAVFCSDASNLVPGDTNGVRDAFVFDRRTGVTERVSIADDESQANGPSCESNPLSADEMEEPCISADGRYVAFSSSATNLAAGDTNGKRDVFLRDRTAGATHLISVSTAGVQGNGWSGFPSISDDGTRIAFVSAASNLVANDTNNRLDVFVRYHATPATERVSISTTGQQGTGPEDDMEGAISISGDGRHVAWITQANGLVPADNNGGSDFYVRDLDSATTSCVSVTPGGQPVGDCWGTNHFIDYDGTIIVFATGSPDVVPNDNNGTADVFVRDRTAGVTTRVSIPQAGGEGNGGSGKASCTADGGLVVFHSAATNLVPGTTPGWHSYIVDRYGGNLQLLGVDSSGRQLKGWDGEPYISSDGRYVALFHLPDPDDFSTGQAMVIDRSALTVIDSKLRPNDEPVIASAAAVTAALDGFFYMEQDGIASNGRLAGIRVVWPGTVTRGKRYIVTGQMKTDGDDERYIQATSVEEHTSGWTVNLDSLGMSNKKLGGGSWNYNAGTGAGQRGVIGGAGLNNIGVLAATVGKFSYVDESTFTVDDGSGVDVRCEVPPGVTLHTTWEYVKVTGISSCYKDGSHLKRKLLVRDAGDIAIVTENPPAAPGFVIGFHTNDQPTQNITLIAVLPDGATGMNLYRQVGDEWTPAGVPVDISSGIYGVSVFDQPTNARFRFTAINSAGEGPPSEAIHARAYEVEHGGIVVDSPPEGQTGVSRTPTFSWHPAWSQPAVLKAYYCENHIESPWSTSWAAMTTPVPAPTSVVHGQTSGVFTMVPASGPLPAFTYCHYYMQAVDIENWMFAACYNRHFTTGP